MAHHNLKTDPAVFQASIDGIKNFEIRLNDRDFRPGDTITLVETESSGEEMRDDCAPLAYTGREIDLEVDYILHGHLSGYGLDDGWVIMSVSQC